MTQPSLLDAVPPDPVGDSFTAHVAAYFVARPNVWIPATALEAVGGRQAWRTRVSDARKQYGLRIENRCRRVRVGDQAWSVSEYRLVTQERPGC